MDIGQKSYRVQSAQQQLGCLCEAVDVTLLQTSKDTGVLGDTGKINPFDDVKGQTIKESFSLGKLDWATIIITINPSTPGKEAEAFEQFQLFQSPRKLSKALLECKEVRTKQQSGVYYWLVYLMRNNFQNTHLSTALSTDA